MLVQSTIVPVTTFCWNQTFTISTGVKVLKSAGRVGIVLPEHHTCVGVSEHYLGPTTHTLDSVWEHIAPALG